MADEWPSPVKPASLGVSAVTLASQPALAGIKHLNRLEQVLAAADRQRLGVDEVITCDEHGKPVAVSSGNLFIRSNSRLLTPPLSQCGIAGTRRALILESWAGNAGYEVLEQFFTLDELREADEVFYCNSLVGIRAVATFRDRRWEHYPATTALQRVCQQALATCAG
jgi:4-amino-4-deoxychorismate lyase